SSGANVATFGYLCEHIEELRPDWESGLVDVRRAGGSRPVWHAYLRSLSSEGPSDGFPRALQRSVAADHESLSVAARVLPQVFGEIALDRLSLPELLRHAFVSFELGKWLDQRLDAATRRAQLPWVREDYAGSPT